MKGKSSVSVDPSQLSGLSDQQVLESRTIHGDNTLTPIEKDPWWKLYLGKFEDPVIRILMIAAAIATLAGAAHGDYVEGIGIIVAILLATALAFINEYKAAQEFEILNRSDDETPVRTNRNGVLIRVPRQQLVVGDLIHLESGEAVPADTRILKAVSMLVDQASLTGESEPVAKFAHGAFPQSEARDQTFEPDYLYRGTTVVDGHAVCRVTHVGDATKIGKVARAAAEETGEVTPLNEQLSGLSKVIGVVGFLVASLAFVALVVHAFLNQDIILSGPQLIFFCCALAATMVGLSKVWLPWIFDGLELVGSTIKPPEFLERDGLVPWLTALGASVVVIGLSVGALVASGLGLQEFLPPTEAGTRVLAAFMIAVTIIVVAVPEGLAMSVTLSLAYSMRKMTKANTLVRRMHACETIGSATVICSDKTGTLTTSRMVLRQFNSLAFSGKLHANDPESVIVAEAVSVNSTADLEPVEGGFETLGNPTESSLLVWVETSMPGGYLELRNQFNVQSQLTFSTERKFMATYGSSAQWPTGVLHVKGAPEIVLARCASYRTAGKELALEAQVRDAVVRELTDFQSRGIRTLGLALRTTPLTSADLNAAATDLCWLGFAAIEDPIRPEVPNAIRTCLGAGVEVKIITGDNTPTAAEVGRQIGLDVDGEGAMMTGSAFERLNDSEAEIALERMRVLSRAQPQHKQRVVQVLQSRGHVVAVTGDGVNDGPALNYADVGLAMGQTGTSVARAASDMVILNDSFASIASGVMWGRSLYRNIQRFIVFQLTINVAALLIALLGPFIGVAIPLSVIQMLWVNLIMDTFAALALATEPADPSVMRDRPRGRSEFIVTPAMARSIFGWGLTFVAVLIGMLLWMRAHSDGSDIGIRDLTVFYCVFVMLQFWNIFNARRFGDSRSAFVGLWDNKLFLIIVASIFIGQVAIVQFGGSLFRTEPLHLGDWLLVISLTSPVMLVGEFWRWVRRRSATTVGRKI